MREDRGMKASRLAKTLTPDQLAELLSIHWFDLAARELRTPTMRPAADDPTYAPLLANRILTAVPVKGWSARKWRLMTFTDLGRLTMLFRIEDDLRRHGCLALRKLVVDLSDALTDEGPDWSQDGLDNLRRSVANALGMECPEWLMTYRDPPVVQS